MAFKSYDQYDSRWGSMNYNGSSNMANAGCGPTSCAMLAYAVDGKTTPVDTARYMQKHGYAIRNNGTAWNGIPACLKAFGLKNVKEVSKMSDVFAYLDKGYYAIFLMQYKGHVSNKVTWTTSGHFIVVTAHKKKNGKNYLWVHDPGGRRLDSDKHGWYCYETTMKGWIRLAWVAITPKRLKLLETKPATTETPVKLTKREKLVNKCMELAWPKGTAEKKIKYPSGSPTKAYKKALNKAYPNRSWSRQCNKGASCDVAVGVSVRAAGLDKDFPRGLSEQVPHLKNSKKWVRVKVTNRTKIKPGYIVYQERNSGSKHIVIAVKNGNAFNAHHGGSRKTYPVIEKLTKSNVVRAASECRVFKVYKPKE